MYPLYGSSFKPNNSTNFCRIWVERGSKSRAPINTPSISRKITVPTSQNTFQESDFLAFLNEEMNKSFISNISRIYLDKIVLLCKAKNIRLFIVSPPINQKFKNEFLAIKRSLKNSYLKSYFENLKYYPESNFFPDHIHLNKNGLNYFSFQELLTNSTPK